MLGRKYINYQIWYHKVLRALTVTSILIVCLILAIVYCILFKPATLYYATTQEGQIIPLSQASSGK